MRCLPFLLALCLIAGCVNPQPAKLQTPEVASLPVVTNLPSQSIVLTLLESSAEFDTFNVVRTNDSQRVNFTNVIHVLDKHISTVDCNTTTLKNELSFGGPIVIENLNPVFNLLGYYTQEQTNCLVSLQAVKRGITKGLGK